MMPSRLDRLIIELGEQAANALSGKLGDLIIGDDPAASLLAHAMQLVDASRAGSGITRVGNRIIIVTADYRQACRAGAMADERGVRDQVFIRGIDGDLDLDVFLCELRSAGGEQGGRSFALTHLPKSLDALDYFARGLARNYEEMVMIAGANTKHMTRTQNRILENSFVQVRGSRGAGKFRALIAEEPQRNVTEHRPATNDTECGRLYGVGGTFGGAKVDHGGKILAEQIVADMLTAWPAGAAAAESANDPAGLGSDSAGLVSDPAGLVSDPAGLGSDPEAGRRASTGFRFLDLGGGNGQVSLHLLSKLAGRYPGVRCLATDIDADAVLSMRRTLADYIAAGQAEVTWDDAASAQPAQSFDVIALNPPFHAGNRVDSTLILDLLDAARRLLKPGGRLYVVHNSHLRYRGEIEKRFTDVVQLARDPRFTVLRAVRV